MNLEKQGFEIVKNRPEYEHSSSEYSTFFEKQISNDQFIMVEKVNENYTFYLCKTGVVAGYRYKILEL